MTLNGKLIGFVLASALMVSPLANATGADEGAITGVKALTSSRIALYSGPAQAKKVKEVSKDEIQVPLAVSETDEEESFLKVKIGGETYWLNKKQVAVTRAVSVGCLAQGTAPVAGASIRGANAGCKQ